MSTGLHARRATGLTWAEREESLAWTESVERWPREQAAYKAERSSALQFLFFDLRNQAGNIYVRGDLNGTGIFFLLFQIFVLSFLSFLRCFTFLCFLIRTHQKKKLSMHVRTCMRPPGLFPECSMELLTFTSRLFAPNGLDRLFRSIISREQAWRAEPPATRSAINVPSYVVYSHRAQKHQL